MQHRLRPWQLFCKLYWWVHYLPSRILLPRKSHTTFALPSRNLHGPDRAICIVAVHRCFRRILCAWWNDRSVRLPWTLDVNAHRQLSVVHSLPHWSSTRRHWIRVYCVCPGDVREQRYRQVLKLHFWICLSLENHGHGSNMPRWDLFEHW